MITGQGETLSPKVGLRLVKVDGGSTLTKEFGGVKYDPDEVMVLHIVLGGWTETSVIAFLGVVMEDGSCSRMMITRQEALRILRDSLRFDEEPILEAIEIVEQSLEIDP